MLNLKLVCTRTFSLGPLLVCSLVLPLPSHAVINGQPAADQKFESVGALKIGKENSPGCTATLIAAKWIVTADHCIESGESSEEEGGASLKPSEYEFRLGNDFLKPVFKSKLKRWVAGPQIQGETLDIAFGELATSADRFAPVPMLTQQWTQEDLRAPYIHIGYGVAVPFFEQDHPLKNKRQMALLSVTAAEGNALLKLFGTEKTLEAYLTKFHPQSLEDGSTDAMIPNGELVPGYSVHAWDERGREDLRDVKEPASGWQDTCFGDSGGPLLRERDGKLSIVGVVSRGMDRICTPIGTRFTVFGPKVMAMVKKLGIGE